MLEGRTQEKSSCEMLWSLRAKKVNFSKAGFWMPCLKFGFQGQRGTCGFVNKAGGGGCGVWAGCWPSPLQVAVQKSSPPSPGTLTITTVLPLGFVKERVACSAGNVTAWGLDIKLWGFMLWGCFLSFCWFSMCCFSLGFCLVPVTVGSSGMGQGMCFLLAAGKCLVQLLGPEGGPYIPVKLEVVACNDFD